MYSTQEVVLTRIQDIVIKRYPGCDQFRNPAFYDGLGELGVFELVANGHPLACPHQFGEVGV